MRPLDGSVVVSLEQAVAAPFASRQLGDLGARVIKIERPGRGDFARDYDRTVRGMSSHFVWLNRNKQSVCLDLKTDSGRDAVRRIVAGADVFIQNLAPGAADRLGLSGRELRASNPRLITCSISGYGHGGPYEQKKAYDLIVQCESGLLSITGTPEAPAKAGIPVADIAAGMYAQSGVLAALLLRGRTGRGSHVEVSMLEALVEWLGFPYYYTAFGGTPPPRSGARHAAIAPYGPFRSSDGERVFLAVQNEREWGWLCERVLRRPELITDGRFIGNTERVDNVVELTAVIEETLSTLPAGTIVGRLDAAGIANGRLRPVADIGSHPQLVGRERWTRVGSEVGELPALWPPGLPSGSRARMDPVPRVGEHTASVLAEFP